MGKKRLVVLSSVLAVLLMASHAWGFAGYRSPASPKGYCPQMSDQWSTMLSLTEDQKERIREMNTAFGRENNELREQLYSRHQELRQLWAETSPDENRIFALNDEIAEIKARLRSNITHHRLQMRNEVLTHEQREKLSEYMQAQSYRRGFRTPGPEGRSIPGEYRERPDRMNRNR